MKKLMCCSELHLLYNISIFVTKQPQVNAHPHGTPKYKNKYLWGVASPWHLKYSCTPWFPPKQTFVLRQIIPILVWVNGQSLCPPWLRSWSAAWPRVIAIEATTSPRPHPLAWNLFFILICLQWHCIPRANRRLKCLNDALIPHPSWASCWVSANSSSPCTRHAWRWRWVSSAAWLVTRSSSQASLWYFPSHYPLSCSDKETHGCQFEAEQGYQGTVGEEEWGDWTQQEPIRTEVCKFKYHASSLGNDNGLLLPSINRMVNFAANISTSTSTQTETDLF